MCHDCETCKSGRTSRDAVRNVDLPGAKEPRITWGQNPTREAALLRGHTETCHEDAGGRYTQDDSRGGSTRDAACLPPLPWQRVVLLRVRLGDYGDAATACSWVLLA